jgi:hypothetical protein
MFLTDRAMEIAQETTEDAILVAGWIRANVGAAWPEGKQLARWIRFAEGCVRADRDISHVVADEFSAQDFEATRAAAGGEE